MCAGGITTVCAIEKVGGVRDGQQERCKTECASCRFRRTGKHSILFTGQGAQSK